ETSEEKKDTKTVSVSMLIRNLQQKYPFLTTVNIDKKDVKIEFHFPVQAYQIFMLAAIERASKRSFIRQDKGVTKTTFVETKDGGCYSHDLKLIFSRCHYKWKDAILQVYSKQIQILLT